MLPGIIELDEELDDKLEKIVEVGPSPSGSPSGPISNGSRPGKMNSASPVASKPNITMPMPAATTSTGATVGWLLPGLIVVIIVFAVKAGFTTDMEVKPETLLIVVGGEM